MDLVDLIFIVLGGGLGAITRFSLTLFFVSGLKTSFPHGTICSNLLGSFLICLFFGFLLTNPNIEILESLENFIVVGFLGALTTYSTFAFDLLGIINNYSKSKAFYYVIINILGGLTSGILGFFLAVFLA